MSEETAFTVMQDDVLSKLSAMATDSSLADTIIRVGNKGNTRDFHVVGALLACESPMFKSQLFGRMQEAQPTMVEEDDDDTQSTLSTSSLTSTKKKFVRVEDISPDAFHFIIQSFYASKPSLNKSIVASVA